MTQSSNTCKLANQALLPSHYEYDFTACDRHAECMQPAVHTPVSAWDDDDDNERTAIA